jgi:hypothetical protein
MHYPVAGVVKDKYKRYFAYGGGASQTVSTGQKYQYTGQPYDDDGTQPGIGAKRGRPEYIPGAAVIVTDKGIVSLPFRSLSFASTARYTINARLDKEIAGNPRAGIPFPYTNKKSLQYHNHRLTVFPIMGDG